MPVLNSIRPTMAPKPAMSLLRMVNLMEAVSLSLCVANRATPATRMTGQARTGSRPYCLKTTSIISVDLAGAFAKVHCFAADTAASRSKA